LTAYRATPTGFVVHQPDTNGRLLVEPARVYLSLRDDRLTCHDATTGEEFPYDPVVRKALAEARRSLEAERQRAEARLRELEKRLGIQDRTEG
jgi:hypothetical protein